MKKKLLIPLLFLPLGLFSQNCTKTSVGLTPIPILGTNTWKGYQGGLYPNGSNIRPTAHNITGVTLANQVFPLDTNGNVDSTLGKVVLITVGMSNTSNESQQFVPMTDTFQNRNPYLKAINGAQGGQTAAIIKSPTANFWTVITQRLNNAGLSDKQVQAIWFKEADASPSDSIFPNYANNLRSEFKTIMNVMKSRYPNLKLCYLSSRIYGGYATTALNPEPYAYHSGWSVKWTVEDQINGDTTLVIGTKSPWLSWGPYIWADGLTPNSDSLVWVCPDDYNTDGTHPNPAGSKKVANLLMDFFTTDETTVPWFIKKVVTSQNDELAFGLKIFVSPNPFTQSAQLKITSLKTQEGTLILYSITGSVLRKIDFTGNEVLITRGILPAGIYFYSVRMADGGVGRGRIIVAE